MTKTITVTIPIKHLKEGESYICYSPVFDLAAHGESAEDAQQSFVKSLKLVIEEISRKSDNANILRH